MFVADHRGQDITVFLRDAIAEQPFYYAGLENAGILIVAVAGVIALFTGLALKA